MKLPTALGFVVMLAAQHALALAAAPIEIVAAENFYGDVAEQIGGADVRVTSILSDPAVDPHLFEASPSVARVISGARVVVYNGIDYDPWMATLLAASPVINRRTMLLRRSRLERSATTHMSGMIPKSCSPMPPC